MSEIYTKSGQTGFEIAVIGMAGRFPGAENIDEFWENLIDGVESMSFFSDNELEQSGISSELFRKSNYVRARGILESAEYFDSAFFNYSPKESEMLDPQIRVCLECTWQALEDAGYNPETYDGSIGIYAGASDNLYLQVLPALSARSNRAGQFNTEILNNKDYLGLRVSYDLNLRGPAITLYTTCSTSLVAIDMACKSLLIGQCDIALAGGVRINVPNKVGYTYQEGMVNSSDGHTRAFDASANGTNGGEGIGIVVLKPLGEAIADGDYIHAVIKGSAINNDGKRKVGFTAPSVEGQEDVIRAALHMAEVEPESIGYIETHGTGTSLGDPIEIQALVRAFDTDKKQFCKIGSVKPNIGHLDSAAGIAGFIKAVLTLKYKQIPPCINFNTPNPKIDFENTPFCVNTRLSGWKNNGYPLRAGVSSFGIGGTNAHVILEEAPILAGGEPASRPFQLLLLSAKTPSALEKISENLVDYFKKNHPDHGNHENHINPGFNFADAAYTLQVGRKALKHRKVLVSPGINGAVDALTSRDSGKVHSFVVEKNKMPVIFLFSGQGSQYENMGLDIYREEQVFQQEMNHCFDILRSTTGYDLKDIIYPKEKAPTGSPRKISSKTILQQDIIQPLMFIFEYSLARLFMKWGIKPYAMIGYSIGEYVAACLSGVFTLEDALTLAALRGRLMHEIQGGAMLSVPLTENDLKPLLRLHPGISIAVVNGPSCIVSGPEEAISSFKQRMKEKKYICIRLNISHAGHSKMMDPMLGKFEEKVRQVKLNKPALPYISNVTGTWITVEQAADPCYWVKQVRETVRFADGLEELLKEKSAIFVEIGPGGDLSSILMQHHAKTPNHRVVNTTRYPQQKVSDVYYLLEKIGRLWLYGQEIDWSEFYRDEKRRRMPLPYYPFDRHRYHVQVPGLEDVLDGNIIKNSGKKKDGKKADIADWFYIPSWKISVLPLYLAKKVSRGLNWLLFVDEGEIGSQLAKRLKQENHNVVIVKAGSGFSKTGSMEYKINPQNEKDYFTLMSHIDSPGYIPDNILHLWNVFHGNGNEPDSEWYNECRVRGFYSLLFLAKVVGREAPDKKIKISVISNNMQGVSGEELLYPEKAVLLGPVRTIPKEYPNISTRSIDIIINNDEAGQKHNHLIDRLFEEIMTESSDPVIAYRGNKRLLQIFEPAGWAENETAKSRLKQRGVYLITGGLGGIGFILAEYLAKTVKARLVLTGRSVFPSRDAWDQWTADHEKNDPTSYKIKKLMEIERLGAEILVFCADVSDQQRMKKVITRAECRFGKINGIIHCAGIADGALIDQIPPGRIERVLCPKVKGTLVLDTIFKNSRLDFFVLCSSFNSIQSSMGNVSYCAANAFLDAYAHYKNARDGLFTISINWDAWQEVGGAVQVAARMAKSIQEPGTPIENQNHPLLDRYVKISKNLEIFISKWRADKYWMLSEHRIKGKAVLPGTAYLEILGAAFEKCAPNGIIEINDLFLFNPLIIEDIEESEVRIVFKKEKEIYEFFVISLSNTPPNQWVLHARGKIKASDEKPQWHNIKEIESSCHNQEIIVSHQETNSNRKLVQFGPRWKNISTVIKTGKNQAVAHLKLPGEFASDIKDYKLHPALMDGAISIAQKTGEFYLPFSFKKVIIKSSLPQKIISYTRYPSDNGSGEQFLNYHITILDEKGREIVCIEDYTLISIPEGKIPGMEYEPGEEDPFPGNFTLPDEALGNDFNFQKGLLKNGILNSEGVEVFERVLGITTPQLIISTVDLSERLRHYNAENPLPFSDSPGSRNSSQKKPRPELSIPYTAPGNAVEKLIAEVWQNFLGVDRIGIHDNFFELGASSLIMIQVNSILRKKIKGNMPIVTMYAHPTIHRLARYLGEEIPNKALEEKISRIKGNAGKDKLKQRKRNIHGGR